MACPMCSLIKYQIPDKDDKTKTKCRGCGTIYFDKTKVLAK